MPKAIISVSDKTGIVEFCRGLVGMGWELIASAGTARLLRENELPVTEVSEFTGFPEILDGRVKTLHPAIHGGLLALDTDADRKTLSELGFGMIDLAAVNLYPFGQTIEREGITLADAVEMIDIGGVALIRAAAKNFERVTLVCDPADYGPVLADLKHQTMTLEKRQTLAAKGFTQTSIYDRLIGGFLSGHPSETLTLFKIQNLRYGENPHQAAEVYGYTPDGSPLGGEVLHGKPLSFNNLLDLDAAWRAVAGFEEPAVVIVKHLSPCGIALGKSQAEAFQKALAGDPVSAFGSVVSCNREIDLTFVDAMRDLFVECLIAPSFSQDALDVLTRRKNLRLVRMPDSCIEPDHEWRSILRGFVRQEIDRGDPQGQDWEVVTQRHPTPKEWEDLRFAWQACQFVKSNAILLANDAASVGICGGQPNRVDCVRIAADRAGERAKGSVMASDAYFPFPDSIEVGAAAGVTAVIQPGGSIRDDLAIKAADDAGLAMVMTGIRHFRH